MIYLVIDKMTFYELFCFESGLKLPFFTKKPPQQQQPKPPHERRLEI